MVVERSEKKAWRTAFACCAVAIVCMVLPTNLQSEIRATANDLLRPGQELVRPLVVRTRSEAAATNSVVGADSGELLRLQEQLRQQAIREANLREQLKFAGTNGRFPYDATSSERLIVHELLQARVLGRERELDGASPLLLDLGSASGAKKGAFVVRTDSPVLDQGTDSGIRAGQPVYAGRCVLGRIVRTGRWTSAVQLISDPKYASRAQLLRETNQGFKFGAECMLEGQGDGTCRLSGVPSTEPVAVGDSVYTGGRTARFPAPMFYGTVTEARLESDQRWLIVVKPQLNADDVRDVAVLREQLRSQRVLGQ